jgi:hypothetical protein
MTESSSSAQEVMLGASTTKDLLRRGSIRQISLQTEGGQTLIGAPVAIDVARAVPGVFKAPAWAAVCATALVAILAGLKIVVERDG